MDKLKELFLSNTMYYIIVPLFIVLVGWVKNWYDTIHKNAKIGRWKIKYKKECPFFKIGIKMFSNSIGVYESAICLVDLLGAYEHREIIAVISCIANLMFMRTYLKEAEIRVEFLKFKKTKIFIISILIILISISIGFMESMKFLIVWISLIGLWFALVYVFSDKVVTYNKRYANIYISGGMLIEQVRIDKMKRQGNWVSFQKIENGKAKEIKIRENLLERIDYFGEPLIVVKNIWK